MAAISPGFFRNCGTRIGGALYLGPKRGYGGLDFGLFIRILIAVGVNPEIGYFHPPLVSKKRATWSGGGLAAISP